MTAKETISYTPPGPVAAEFISDRTPFSIIMGPVGSGKSVAAVMKMMAVALTQQPYNRHRYSRFLVARNTYPELKSTTIKSFLEWFPEGITTMNWGGLISAKLNFELQDKTALNCEIFFISLDRPEEVAKIRGMELTGAWLNECSEMTKAAWDMATQRVGRYPPKRWGGATWSGVFGDMNPPDDDHWSYKLFVESKPEHHRLFRQPGALLYQNGVYTENPAAENVQNHALGYEYWKRQIAGKTREWCKVFLEGNWGTISTGKPVYPEYSDELHCREFKPYEGLPLLLGFDYGLTPAVSICQVSPRGQFRILADIQSENMGIRQFSRDVVKPFLAMNFPGYKIQATGDPAGNRRADSDEKTCFMELAEAGIPAMPAITNEFLARREAVAGYLTKIIDGEPALLVHPEARNNRKGFNGGYCFKRVQIVGTERYRDVPDKSIYSHCFPGWVRVWTECGEKPISDVQVGDFVRTPLGYRRVTATMSREVNDLMAVNTSEGCVECTPDHPFILPHGVVLADALRYNDVLIGINTKEEAQWANQQSMFRRISMVSGITASLRGITRRITSGMAALVTCTATFGSFISGSFQRGMKFITGMETNPIITSPIWNPYRQENIGFTTTSTKATKQNESAWRLSIKQGSRQRSGIVHLKRVKHIPEVQGLAGKEGKNKNTFVRTVERITKRILGVCSVVFVQWPARVLQGEIPGWMTNIGAAWFVGDNFALTNTQKHAPALKVVGVLRYRTANPVRVYDITVEDAHCFYANGILVHNCCEATQYAALYTQTMSLAGDFGKKIAYPELGLC